MQIPKFLFLAPIATKGKVIISPDDGADRTFEVRITQIQLEQVYNIQFVHHVMHTLAFTLLFFGT